MRELEAIAPSRDSAAQGSAFDTDGYAIIPAILSIAACDRLLERVDACARARAGSRRLLDEPLVAEIAGYLQQHPAIAAWLPARAQVLQCTLFAKTPDANWSVTPHQDLSVPVRERMDAPGWSGWSIKEGVSFAQPPLPVLEQLLAVRLQLDGDAETTGPLEVIPGSHRSGRLSMAALKEHFGLPRVRCIVPKGGVLVLRPLLVHASGKGSGAGHRRVLHFLYGPPLQADIPP